MKKHCSLLLLCFTICFNCIAKSPSQSIIGSLGLGFPSIMGYAVANSANQTIIPERLYQPVMSKLEYKRGKWGVSLNYTTSFTQFRFHINNTSTYNRISYNINSVTLRGNYYFLEKKIGQKKKMQLQSFGGLGAGKIVAEQHTTTHYPGLPGLSSTAFTFEKFPMSLEATVGTRFFPIPQVGVFAEIGAGNMPIQLIDKFLGDSYIQGGISVKLDW
jgi:hypothetical protein